jgi:hypothetical protein
VLSHITVLRLGFKFVKSLLFTLDYCLNLYLIDAGKEVGLEVNTEKTKYMMLSRQQNGGQNQDIKIGNRCFGNVE